MGAVLDRTAAGLTNAVTTRGLTKRYGSGVLANDDISLSVPAGSVLGLLGANGAGKTTLVRQITGELVPTAGEISVMGVDVVRDHARARGLMGVVPQEAQPYDHLRPAEHLAYFGRMRGMSRSAAARRAGELLDLLGLAQHSRQMARQLSGGLKRKLLVGVALVGDPAVLVLDEPTTGLDPHARREVWTLLQRLRRRGRTVIITTHYMEEAEELCDAVALIDAGRIRVQGTIEDLRGRCRNRYKATYENGRGREAVLGETSEAVLSELTRRGIEVFALGRTSLEDMYLELTAAPAEVR
jgi:ABC-2 type transport system ATP-binding protein